MLMQTIAVIHVKSAAHPVITERVNLGVFNAKPRAILHDDLLHLDVKPSPLRRILHHRRLII